MSDHVDHDHVDHENAYAGLMVNDTHWAFGTDFEDPLAGVDTTVPEGIAGDVLAGYCLMLGDDALVLSHRLSQWCSNAPDLEIDIALTNIALDLLGQGRLLLARAAAADPSALPASPADSPIPPEDLLAFFRDDHQFRNVTLVEHPNGDFAETVVRLLFFACWRLALLQQLVDSRDPVLAAIAAKGIKEVAYHRDFAGRWFVTLADGTEDSRRRTIAAVQAIWPELPELFIDHPIEVTTAAVDIGVAPSATAEEVGVVLDQLFAAATVQQPPLSVVSTGTTPPGRNGQHTDELATMLTEMQSVARRHPLGSW